MFALIESCPDSRPGFGWMGKATSLAIHSFVFAIAASLTHPGQRADSVARADTTIFWVRQEPHVLVGGAPRGSVSLPAPPSWRVVVPTTIPVDLPPASLNEQLSTPYVPDQYLWPGTSTNGLTSDSSSGTSGIGNAPVDERLADERPELLSHPPVEFPEALRQAGISGHVMIETVIDTLGHAERGLTKVIRGAHPMFDAEARTVVLGSTYRPGRVAGRAVRVRVQVPVNFEIR